MDSNKLVALSARKLGSQDCADRERRLKEFQRRIGAALPAGYGELLLEYGAPLIFDKDVYFRPAERSPWDRDDGTQSLELLYGLCGQGPTLDHQYDVYAGRVPDGVIPIGEAPGGDLVAVAVNGSVAGKVYLWDHENERPMTGVRGNDFGNMHLIADSLEDSLNSLHAREDAPRAGNKGDGIVNACLADDL